MYPYSLYLDPKVPIIGAPLGPKHEIDGYMELLGFAEDDGMHLQDLRLSLETVPTAGDRNPALP